MATLLVGDTSSNIHRVVDLTFSGHDIGVVTVSDGEQAVARLETDPPDIVLIDVALPTRSGYEVCEFIKRSPALSHIPVLLLAGAFDPIDEGRAQRACADGVVVKPFEPQHLATRVRELLAGRRGAAADVVSGVPRAMDRLGLRRSVPVQSHAPDVQSRDGRPDLPAARRDPAVDEYFERLNAALSSRPLPGVTPPTTEINSESHLDDVTGREVGDGVETPASSAAGAVGELPLDLPTLDRLLEKESPERAATDDPRASRMEEPSVSDALVDEVTQRVLKRLSADAVDRAVASIVTDVAERLVREEIARIRGRS